MATLTITSSEICRCCCCCELLLSEWPAVLCLSWTEDGLARPYSPDPVRLNLDESSTCSNLSYTSGTVMIGFSYDPVFNPCGPLPFKINVQFSCTGVASLTVTPDPSQPPPCDSTGETYNASGTGGAHLINTFSMTCDPLSITFTANAGLLLGFAGTTLTFVLSPCASLYGDLTAVLAAAGEL